jgi:RNA polymerase sigma-70 factor (ECF subfamily)
MTASTSDVRAAAAGDRFAFARVLDSHYDRMYRTAWMFCRNKEDAEDVAQTVCVKLASVIGSFDGRSSFTTWLHTIVVNVAKDHRRRVRPEMHVDIDDVDVADEPSAADGVRTDLWRAVDRLPERQKECVILVHLQGFSHTEAAAMLDISAATVSWHVHEARKRLQAALADAPSERRVGA